jgi:hypothetical protein
MWDSNPRKKTFDSKVEATHTPLHPMLQNLAVLGGNDPHSYGVTSRRASMNTLGPKIGGDGWIRTTALFRGEIYSLVQSTTLPRLQNLPYKNTLPVPGIRTHFSCSLPRLLRSGK